MANVNGGALTNQQQGGQAVARATVKSLLTSDKMKQRFEDILGKKAQGFMASVINISNSTSLHDAEPMSVISAAAIAATLDLPIDPNLGHAWLVPYNDKRKGKVAQFQMATRGYVQLAQRTGQYKRLNSIPVYQNQFKSWNGLTEELDADFSLEGEGNIVGYAVYFSLINGFEKLVYWSKEKVTKHAKKYSKTFNNGPWQTNFDEMALKTVLKDTLKKWGILSIQMQTAINADQAIVKETALNDNADVNESFDYADNPNNSIDAEFTPIDEKDEFAGTPFSEEK
jgi:recombination protein RecT